MLAILSVPVISESSYSFRKQILDPVAWSCICSTVTIKWGFIKEQAEEMFLEAHV